MTQRVEINNHHIVLNGKNCLLQALQRNQIYLVRQTTSVIVGRNKRNNKMQLGKRIAFIRFGFRFI